MGTDPIPATGTDPATVGNRQGDRPRANSNTGTDPATDGNRQWPWGQTPDTPMATAMGTDPGYPVGYQGTDLVRVVCREFQLSRRTGDASAAC